MAESSELGRIDSQPSIQIGCASCDLYRINDAKISLPTLPTPLRSPRRRRCEWSLSSSSPESLRRSRTRSTNPSPTRYLQFLVLERRMDRPSCGSITGFDFLGFFQELKLDPERLCGARPSDRCRGRPAPILRPGRRPSRWRTRSGC